MPLRVERAVCARVACAAARCARPHLSESSIPCRFIIRKYAHYASARACARVAGPWSACKRPGGDAVPAVVTPRSADLPPSAILALASSASNTPACPVAAAAGCLVTVALQRHMRRLQAIATPVGPWRWSCAGAHCFNAKTEFEQQVFGEYWLKQQRCARPGDTVPFEIPMPV